MHFAGSAEPCPTTPAANNRVAGMEGWHFWFEGRRCLVEELLAGCEPDAEARVLDVGCGTGYNLEFLRGRGWRMVGIDRQPAGGASARLAPVLAADALSLPFASGSFDLVFMLDVLEHVEDGAAVREVARVLKPGGTLLVTVPAFPFLWSRRDQVAGHLRRYRAASLDRVLRQAGFEPIETRYYQFFLFPLVLLTRWTSRDSSTALDAEERPPRVLNSILSVVNRLEVRMGRRIRWPWGSSLASVSRRMAV